MGSALFVVEVGRGHNIPGTCFSGWQYVTFYRAPYV
jgi:hypothetical protein